MYYRNAKNRVSSRFTYFSLNQEECHDSVAVWLVSFKNLHTDCKHVIMMTRYFITYIFTGAQCNEEIVENIVWKRTPAVNTIAVQCPGNEDQNMEFQEGNLYLAYSIRPHKFEGIYTDNCNGASERSFFCFYLFILSYSFQFILQRYNFVVVFFCTEIFINDHVLLLKNQHIDEYDVDI